MGDRSTVFRLLERDLVEWADDTSLRLVWADLLQLSDDPLGELVVLDHALETAPAEHRDRLAKAAEALRQRLAPRMWTQASREIRSDPGVQLRWQLGFVREVDIVATKLRLKPRSRTRRRSATIGATISWLLPRLLREPALRFVESIRVDIRDDQAPSAATWAYEIGLGAGTLREVHIGHPPRTDRRPSGQWETGENNRPSIAYGPSSEQLGVHFRRLRRFSIAGEMQRIHCRSGASQTREHHIRRLPSRPLTSPNRASFSRALWDASSLVHQAAFAAAAELGPRGEFLLDDLVWFLRPPVSKKDPRPALAFSVLGAIGPASASLLPEVIGSAEALLFKNDARREAMLRWFVALGPLAKAGLPIIEDTLRGKPRGREPKSLRATARAAKRAVSP